MSIRNDGIGGTPRLARYITFTAADDAAPTPGRPPLPKRTPGETDPDHDGRFQLAGARGVAAAPYGAVDDSRSADRTGRAARSPALSRAIHDANSTARTHLPNRTTGECHRCGGVPGPCRPFLRAIAILDRWEPANARRIRAVLHLSGLMPAGYPHDDKDETAESYGALDDA
ncbi:hypothetical protein EDC02_0227 [Micromonospora sp. Llam0]|uniref:hypothetical protein n=1 Tax=Micromonospora sp. Llam0 TaxID=2485143 RepID=UPI000F47D5D5|nr:hypothetical protein [Micromonospora sp. Llam0]ROO58467.1 hypothetical protein EDC02_0227 [Micromonospora sp. Llam0]